MAYEMFDELSTCDLDEICEEDLYQIKDDIETELRRRTKVKKAEAISKFREAFNNLCEEEITLKVEVHCYDSPHFSEMVTLYDFDDFDFEY